MTQANFEMDAAIQPLRDGKDLFDGKSRSPHSAAQAAHSKRFAGRDGQSSSKLGQSQSQEWDNLQNHQKRCRTLRARYPT